MMNFRLLSILAALIVALVFVGKTMAAPAAQLVVNEEGVEDVIVEEVIAETSSFFTLTVRIDEVTTVDIPLQVDWRAQGSEGDDDQDGEEVSVSVVPTVLRNGFFAVTVGGVETLTRTLSVSLSAPTPEPEVATPSESITSTAPVTATDTAVPTDTLSTTTEPVANQIANLRTGPGTEFDVVNTAEVGTVLNVIGQNEDGSWLALAGGVWIAAFLVNNIPTDLPVVSPAVAPPPLLPTPTPTAGSVAIPTATPAPTQTSATEGASATATPAEEAP